MASVSIYNHHRFARSSLKRSRKFDASLTIELYGDHWRFKGSDTVLEYDGPMRPFLIALRAQTIPSFMIPLLLEQEPKIPLNEGCLIIEVHDYRPPNHSQLDLVDKRKLGTNIYARNPFKNSRASQWGAGFGPSSSMPGVMGTASSSTAAGVASGSNGIIQPAQSSVSGETGEPSYIKNRIMMKPDSESLYETLLATHQSWNRDAAKNSHPPLEWDDNSILELEARILAAIAPPLSLDTSFLSTRVANLSSTLTVPTLPHMSADGSYIPRARRRELAYGKATIRDDDEDIEEDVANTNSDTAEDSKEQTTAHSAAVGETLGIGKKDWALLVFGTKKTSAASIQQSGRRPIDEQFFAARQARTRMDQKRPMNAAAAARPEPAPQPEQDVRQHNMNGPVRNGEGSVNSAGNDNGGDNGMAKKPKPKKKKKPIEPDSNEIIDVDAVSTVPVAMNGDADNGAGKGKLKPKPKLNAAAIKAAKKRNADEMDGEGTVAGSPATVDTSIAPTPTTMRPKPKKLTKKQQEALAKQQAAEAVAAAQAEPPRKKAKKAPVPHNASFNQNHQPVPGVPNGEAYSQYQDAGMGGFNGLPVNMNMGNIAMGSGIPGISQDDFLAAAEALGESMPGMMMDPPIQQQQFGAPDQMQMAMGNMMQTGGPQAMSRQPGGQSRAPHGSQNKQKILLVLYDGGKSAEEEPRLLGTTENKLGIAQWLQEQGHELVTTSDKEGPNSEFRKHIKDAHILITTPFHPGYLTREVMDTAKNLRLCVTAGVGSDHVDLDAANERKITVAEVTGSNVVSVAEHVVMTILNGVRNFVPAHEQVMAGGWDVAAVARNAFDLEGKVVGTLACGRIGYRVLQRLKAFDCKELLYYDYIPLPKEAQEAVGCRRVENLDEFLGQCDVITVNTPLHAETKGMINKEFLSKLKKGAFLINTARGALAVAEDVAEALKSGQINFYGGDVWFPQPAPKDHPWRAMRNSLDGGNGMVPHYSGTTLDAQKRYADGTKDILKRYFSGEAQEPVNLIVENGEYATKAYGQRKTKADEQKEQVRVDGNA